MFKGFGDFFSSSSSSSSSSGGSSTTISEDVENVSTDRIDLNDIFDPEKEEQEETEKQKMLKTEHKYDDSNDLRDADDEDVTPIKRNRQSLAQADAQKIVDYSAINDPVAQAARAPIIKSDLPIHNTMREFEKFIVGMVNVSNASQYRRSDHMHKQEHIFFWPCVLETIKEESDFTDRIVLDTLMTRGALRWAIEYTLFSLQNKYCYPNLTFLEIIRDPTLSSLFANLMSLYLYDNDIGRFRLKDYENIDENVNRVHMQFYIQLKKTPKRDLKQVEFVVPYVPVEEHSPYPSIQKYLEDIMRRDMSHVKIDMNQILYLIGNNVSLKQLIIKKHSRIRLTEFVQLHYNLNAGKLAGATDVAISRLSARYSNVLSWLQNYVAEGCNCSY